MDIQSQQTQHRTKPNTDAKHPRDLTWLGLANERELLCLAREIAANNAYVDRVAKVSDRIADKPHGGHPGQG